MVVRIGGAPAGAEDRTPGTAARPGPAPTTRRHAVRGLIVSAFAAALAPVAVALRPSRPESVPGTAQDATAFDQIYRGCRIRGVWHPARGAAEDGRWHVTVDGRPLHLMRRADGTWLSMVDHYRPYRTPLDAARAAVDELGPARLRDLAPGPVGAEHSHTEDEHGVRA
ncbi:tyrosinase family oxidase copper chaperone [Streptomyces sp. Li-HN-5-11]|uniref:tyrosinase family oxidase copper chaperone n=1 Tax=Streptomyces sp. Li-HN-5-11 TaxID=3075432 RepID=UPI0028AB21FD|nr:tyrosinase family oxidase copper chaperone [Streptomyces sp. Li-HN-5-11]WNM35208.1 tyrosinase family oxidase copper chaperone [Streptomyces sp. Li-HN-5-11]